MYIFWHGQSCFEIIVSPSKDERVRIVIDLFSDEIGLKVPRLSADILLITHNHPDHNNVKAVGGNPFIIDTPGEYEIKNVFLQGIRSSKLELRREKSEALRTWHDNEKGEIRGENIIYTIEAEDLRLCHLGDLGQKELTGEQLEQIGDIDILMVPVGGVYTIDHQEAMKIITQIEPGIIIPMHYQLPGLKVKLNGVDKFFKSLGVKLLEPLNKLSIKKKDILPEEPKIILLKP